MTEFDWVHFQGWGSSVSEANNMTSPLLFALSLCACDLPSSLQEWTVPIQYCWSHLTVSQVRHLSWDQLMKDVAFSQDCCFTDLWEWESQMTDHQRKRHTRGKRSRQKVPIIWSLQGNGSLCTVSSNAYQVRKCWAFGVLASRFCCSTVLLDSENRTVFS